MKNAFNVDMVKIGHINDEFTKGLKDVVDKVTTFGVRALTKEEKIALVAVMSGETMKLGNYLTDTMLYSLFGEEDRRSSTVPLTIYKNIIKKWMTRNGPVSKGNREEARREITLFFTAFFESLVEEACKESVGKVTPIQLKEILQQIEKEVADILMICSIAMVYKVRGGVFPELIAKLSKETHLKIEELLGHKPEAN